MKYDTQQKAGVLSPNVDSVRSSSPPGQTMIRERVQQ